MGLCSCLVLMCFVKHISAVSCTVYSVLFTSVHVLGLFYICTLIILIVIPQPTYRVTQKEVGHTTSMCHPVDSSYLSPEAFEY